MADGEVSIKRNGNETLLSVVVAIAVLYLARVVFIPLALALLLAFLLGPLVIRLRRWHLGRVPATLLVVAASFLVVALMAGGMASQFTDLAHNLPGYEQNVRQKLQSLRKSGGGYINRVTRLVQNFSDEVMPAPPPAKPPPGEERPVPVEIRKPTFSPLESAQKLLGSVLNIVLMAAIVVVFVIFMLIQREDLRDRVIRLAGQRRVNMTTKVLDDAAQRVSRYLLFQLLINLCYGLLAGVGLFFIGVPNPILWGSLAAVLRYVPYLGIWIAAAMPAIVALAVEPGWLKLWLVFALYGGVDIIVYNFVEPLLYGSSTGISPIAILVAAVFWAWLWGPVGLLLSTPLTVCLVVIGRHVPRLGFLNVLLSDEPVLPTETRLYQRLLAGDIEEATEVAEEFLKSKPLDAFYDDAAVPALSLAEKERHNGRIDSESHHAILQNLQLLLEDVTERVDEISKKNGDGDSDVQKESETLDASGVEEDAHPLDASNDLQVICVPARNEADEIAAQLMVQLLDRRGITSRSLRSCSLLSECLSAVTSANAPVVCIVSIPPFGLMHVRYLCRRLKAESGGQRVVAAVLTEGELDEVRKRAMRISADEVVNTLKDAVSVSLALAASTRKQAEPEALAHSR